MDSTAVVNLAPIAGAQTAPPGAAMLPPDAPALDFAALLALGLAPAATVPAAEYVLPATDNEDPVIAAAADAAQPDLGALLLPDQLSVPPPAAQALPPLNGPMNPAPAAASATDAAAGSGFAVSAASPERAANFAGREWLPPAPADAPGTARTAFTELLPATTPDGAATVPVITITGWPVQSAAIAQPGAPAPRIDVPLSQPGWSDAFSSRVVWLTGQHQQSAELHVNPPELGPIDIMLSFDHDQAHVHFSSAHLPVREAIEIALPALRDAFSQAGIQLGNTSVSAEGFGRPGEYPDHGSALRVDAGAGAAIHAVLPDHPAAAHIGLIDTFA